MFPKENKIEHAKLKETELNLKLSNWDKQYKLAIEIGDQTESDLFEGLENDFDKEAW